MSNNNKEVDKATLIAALKEKNKIIDELKTKFNEPIAIIGMSCRFPGSANTLDEFWQLLEEGRDAIKKIPNDRFNVEEYYDPDPDKPFKMYVKGGGFIDEIDKFDPTFFGISPREAVALDPQHRLLLEVSWEAFEHAGIGKSQLLGSKTGVYIGIAPGDYENLLLNSNQRSEIESHMITGISSNAAAGRISYFFGLQGPSLTIDTACSSSLVAVHVACDNLRSGSVDMALASGVNVIISPVPFMLTSRIRALAPDSHCKTFDESADGFARGEGCGVVILKRLSDAVNNNDKILAVILGTAVNQDGHSNSFTAPNGLSQEILIHNAITKSGINPQDVGYIEAHGTGTPLGDPLEIQSIANTLSQNRNINNPLIIGSVKTNIGHCETAAGIAGLIKTVLSIMHKKIPAHLNFHKINSEISLEQIPAIIPTKTIEWNSLNSERIAGISSFGISGTNAHIVVKEYVESEKNKKLETLELPCQILCISARTYQALKDLSNKYVTSIFNNSDNSLLSICYNAAIQRDHFEYRCAVVAKNKQEMLDNILAWEKNDEDVIYNRIIPRVTEKIVFLFTGQGSQYVGMGKELYLSQPIFKESLDLCAKILNNYIDKDLISILWGDDSKYLNETKYTQPAIFSLEWSLFKLWESWGITPNAVLGHSVGEYVAATVAKVFKLEDGLKLIAKRGSLMQELPPLGSMIAIATDEKTIQSILETYNDTVSIAAINGPNSIVLSGISMDIEKISEVLRDKKIKVTNLKVSHAFHSNLLKPMLDSFSKEIHNVSMSVPELTIISNLTGNVVDKALITSPQYWVEHTIKPVQFYKSILSLINLGYTHFVEIGPHPTLLSLAQESIYYVKDVNSQLDKLTTNYKWMSSINRNYSCYETILKSLAELYVDGANVNWSSFYNRCILDKIDLPSYPFQRERYWIEMDDKRNNYISNNFNPILGYKISSPTRTEITYQALYNIHDTPVISDHRIYTKIVVPGSIHLSRILIWLLREAKEQQCIISDIMFENAMVLQDNQSKIVQMIMSEKLRDEYEISIHSILEEDLESFNNVDAWSINVTCKLKITHLNDDYVTNEIDLDYIKQRLSIQVPVDSYNSTIVKARYQYGKGFICIDQVMRSESGLEALGRMRLSTIEEDNLFVLTPGIIDCCFQLLSACKTEEGFRNLEVAYIPVSIGSLEFHGKTEGRLWCHVISKQDFNNTDKIMQGDMILFTESGHKVATINNFTALQAPKEILLKSIHSVEDVLFECKWEDVGLESILNNLESIDNSRRWILFLPQVLTELIEQLIKFCHDSKIPVILVKFGEEFMQNSEFEFCINPDDCDQYISLLNIIKPYEVDKIIYLSGINSNFDSENNLYNFILDQRFSYFSVINLIRSIMKIYKNKYPKLYLATKDCQLINTDKQTTFSGLSQSTLFGLSKVINLEYPELHCSIIDVTLDGSNSNSELLFKYLLCKENNQNEIAIRKDSYFASRILKLSTDNKNPVNPIVISPDSTYLITGGLGALGLVMANWLVSQGAKFLILFGRKTISQDAKLVIDSLREKGVTIQLFYGDVSNFESVKEIFDTQYESLPPIKGIIHAAGVVEDGLIYQQNKEMFEKVVASKIYGAWNLNKIIFDKKVLIDFIVYFSSVTSILGNIGQANYAAANAFLDALAIRQRKYGIPAISINWGPWKGIGLAAMMTEAKQKQLYETGFNQLDIETATYAMQQIFSKFSDKSEIGAFTVDWHKYIKQLPMDYKPLILSNVVSLENRNNKPIFELDSNKNNFFNELARANLNERSNIISKKLESEVKALLHLGPKIEFDYRTGLTDLGMDSVMAVEFRNRLTKIFGDSFKKSLPPTLIFNYPTIEAICNYLISDVLKFEEKKIININQRKNNEEPIAIIGMSCKFPGKANSLNEFWQVLVDGIDTVSDVPKERFNIEEYYDANPDAVGKSYVKRGSFLENIDLFDADFFGISPREALAMDPQQRILLEVSWEALEKSGIPADQLFGTNTGVFVGVMYHDYLDRLNHSPQRSQIEAHIATGNAFSTVAGRLSFNFGFHGPAMTVDTACSSSLVSIHLACDSLRDGSSDVALAAGVNLIIEPNGFIYLSRIRAYSTDGRCKTFDASADGYARGEGCGVIVLKRLSDAKKDRNNILAIIKGSAINQDGKSSSLTAPNGPAQKLLIRQALANAKIKPHEVSYIEAHGTGTLLGDPIEVNSLGEVYREGRERDNPLILSSVKANIGHTESAAGVASVIKTVLSMQHKKIPAHSNFNKLNPEINLEEIPAKIPQELTSWNSINGKRIAGVSSFGISGTNAHIIIEEGINKEVKLKTDNYIDRTHHVLTLSAKNNAALTETIKKYVEILDEHNFEDIAYSANVGRVTFNSRIAVIAKNSIEAKKRLNCYLEKGESIGVITGESNKKGVVKTVFLFTGQGSQYVGMGRDLYETNSTFKKYLDECSAILDNNNYIDKNLLSLLWGEDSKYLDETKYTQPSLFALEYSLYKLITSWGIIAQAVIGHSVGEYVAACVSGVFNLEDGLRLISKRAQLMQNLPQNGAMAAIATDKNDIEKILSEYNKVKEVVSIAAINGPKNIVISGEKDKVLEIVKLYDANTKTSILKVSHAFHSALLDPMLEEFANALNEIKLSKPSITLISNTSGQVNDEQITTSEYWVNHTRHTVQFSNGINTLIKDDFYNFIEIGPHPVLLAMAQENINEDFGEDNNYLWLPCLRREQDSWWELSKSIGQLYIHGFDINWKAFDNDYIRQVVDLPTYPFQRQKYWVDLARFYPLELVDINQNEQIKNNNLYFDIIWEEKTFLESNNYNYKCAWLIFAENLEEANEFISLIKERGDLVFMIDSAANAQISILEENKAAMMRQNINSIKIVYLCQHDDSSEIDPAMIVHKSRYEAIIKIINYFTIQRFGQFRMYFITQHAQSVVTSDKIFNLQQASMWGFGRTVALEQPSFGFTNIDVDALGEYLYQEIKADDIEDQISYRESKRYVRRIINTDPNMWNNNYINNEHINKEGVYLITGGLGGLGLTVAKWIVDCQVKEVILMSRRAPSSEIISQINQWQSSGTTKIRTVQADVTDKQDIYNLFNQIKNENKQLKGVIHAAGTMEQIKILEQSWDEYYKVIAPKILGALNLHNGLNELEIKLDFFVSFSSTSALLGNMGQSSYAAANSFLDSFSYYQSVNGIKAFSIDWGAWAKVGMAATILGDRADISIGIKTIEPDAGIQAMNKILSQYKGVQITVTDVDWNKYLYNFTNKYNRSFFNYFIKNYNTPFEEKNTFLEKIKITSQGERKKIIISYLLDKTKKVLGLDANVKLDINSPFMTIGMDSILSVEMINKLKHDFGDNAQITTNLLFNYPTIETLGNYLLKILFVETIKENSKNEEIKNEKRNITEEYSKLQEEELALKAKQLLEKIRKNKGNTENE